MPVLSGVFVDEALLLPLLLDWSCRTATIHHTSLSPLPSSCSLSSTHPPSRQLLHVWSSQVPAPSSVISDWSKPKFWSGAVCMCMCARVCVQVYGALAAGYYMEGRTETRQVVSSDEVGSHPHEPESEEQATQQAPDLPDLMPLSIKLGLIRTSFHSFCSACLYLGFAETSALSPLSCGSKPHGHAHSGSILSFSSFSHDPASYMHARARARTSLTTCKLPGLTHQWAACGLFPRTMSTGLLLIQDSARLTFW